MAVFFNSTTQNGGATDDFLFGTPLNGPDNTLNGNDGDDLLWGDSGDFVSITEFGPGLGTSAANAADIDNSIEWSLRENPDIADATTVPHLTIYESVTSDRELWYSVTAGAGETITLDIDYGNNALGDDLDSVVTLFESDGTTEIDNSDDSAITLGGEGSTSTSDSLLTHTFASAGTYLIRVRDFFATFPQVSAPATFILNVSLTGHAATGSTTAGNDLLNGGIGNDTLYGMGGNDTLDGGDGNDVMRGGSGNDTFFGSNGNDLFDGGDGNDLFFAGPGINTMLGGAGDDQLGLFSSDDAAGQVFDGGADVDTFAIVKLGGVGIVDLRDDTVDGIERFAFFDNGGGPTSVIDELQLNAAQFADATVLEASGHAGGTVQLSLFMDSETMLDLSGLTVIGFTEPGDNITVTGDGDSESIIGSSIADTILGNGGDDLIEGGAGGDSLDGGAGTGDTLSYAASGAGVNVDLSSGFASGGDAAGDSFAGFENLTGSAQGDTLEGDSGVNTIMGGDGDDRLRHNASNPDTVGEVFHGGNGIDTLEFRGDGSLITNLRNDSLVSIERYLFEDPNVGGSHLLQLNSSQISGMGFSPTGTVEADVFNDTTETVDILMDGPSLDLSGLTIIDVADTMKFMVTGTVADETITGSSIADIVTGGDGDDTILGGDGFDSIDGGAGRDIIIGGAGSDTLDGVGSVDTISGGGGQDKINGGGSNDSITGDGGADSIDGDSGGDSIDGGTANDLIYGGNGNDTINGGAGNDIIYGEGFTDELYGGDNQDQLFGGGSSDTLYGGNGGDTLTGNNAKDFLFGEAGADSLDGGASNDVMDGGSGNDTLLGATGNDFLTGGTGADIFDFRANHGSDRILDFEDGIDIIRFDINSVQDIGDLTITNNFAMTGSDVNYGTGTIRVDGVLAPDLTSADFLFL